MTQQEIIDKHLNRIVQYEIEKKIGENRRLIENLKTYVFNLTHTYRSELKDLIKFDVNETSNDIDALRAEITQLESELKILRNI